MQLYMPPTVSNNKFLTHCVHNPRLGFSVSCPWGVRIDCANLQKMCELRCQYAFRRFVSPEGVVPAFCACRILPVVVRNQYGYCLRNHLRTLCVSDRCRRGAVRIMT